MSKFLNCQGNVTRVFIKSNKMIVNQLSDFLILKNHLNDRWNYVMDNTSAFRYKLNIRHQKMLEGVFGFVIQVYV